MHDFTEETHIMGFCNMHSTLVTVYIT